jgi:hypothetical protein
VELLIQFIFVLFISESYDASSSTASDMIYIIVSVYINPLKSRSLTEQFTIACWIFAAY